jgi:hypothetical protein
MLSREPDPVGNEAAQCGSLVPNPEFFVDPPPFDALQWSEAFEFDLGLTPKAPIASGDSAFARLQEEPPPAQKRKSRHGNKVKKGDGCESKRLAPDPYDDYPFTKASPAYQRLKFLNAEFLSFPGLLEIGSCIEKTLQLQNAPLALRNRAARRRKPNAFHWFDENWCFISLAMFDSLVIRSLQRDRMRGKRLKMG